MRVPIWISNRHIHLGKADAEKLFGVGYEFKKFKDLSQPWQYACEEVVTLVWAKWTINKVRILWPFRKDTQVEISISDAFALGVEPIVKISGDLAGTPGIKVVGPAWEVEIYHGVIVAQRHLHMTVTEAQAAWLKDQDVIKVRTEWPRWLIFDNVSVRVRDDYALDMHIDIEEANAAGLKGWARGEII